MKKFSKIFLLLINPTKEWEKINNDDTDYHSLVKEILLCVSIIYLCISILNIFLNRRNNGVSIVQMIVIAILFSVGIIIWPHISAKIINGLAPIFKGEKNKKNSFKLAVYCSYSALIGSLLGFIPVKGISYLALCYLIFIRYHGLKVLMKSQRATFIYALFPELIFVIIDFLVSIILTLIQIIFVAVYK